MNSYTYSATCLDCRAEWYVGHMMVSLPLQAGELVRYVCPKCFLGVALPQQIEARFLQRLQDEQTDSFGNPSTFRSWLAQELKRRTASTHRPYSLISLPLLEINCPEDGTPLELWTNYPEDPSLFCARCDSRKVQISHTGEIGVGAITIW